MKKILAFILIVVLVLSLTGCKISPTLSMGGNDTEVLYTLEDEPTYEAIEESLAIQLDSLEQASLNKEELDNLTHFEKLSNQFINEPTEAKNTLNTYIDQNNEDATAEEIEQFKQIFSLIMGMYEYDQEVKEELNIDATIRMKLFGEHAYIGADETIQVPYVTYLEIISLPENMPDLTPYAQEGVESIYGETSMISGLMTGDYDANTESISEAEMQSTIEEMTATYERGYQYLLSNQGNYLVSEVNLRSFTREELENYSDVSGLSAFLEMQFVNDNSMSLSFDTQSNSEKALTAISDQLAELNHKTQLTDDELKEQSKLEEVYKNIFREQKFLDYYSFYGEVKEVNALDDGTYEVMITQLPNNINTVQTFNKVVTVGEKLRVYIDDQGIAHFKRLGQPLDDINVSGWAEPHVNALNQRYVIEQHDFTDYTQPITRRDFAKLIVRLQERVNNKIMLENNTQLMDTNDPYALKAKANNLMNGIGNDYFDPYGSLTREQAATIIGRMLPKDLVVTQQYIMYEDDQLISDWANNHVQIVSKLGLMEGYDNKFHPKDELTIEQAATLINNFIMNDY